MGILHTSQYLRMLYLKDAVPTYKDHLKLNCCRSSSEIFFQSFTYKQNHQKNIAWCTCIFIIFYDILSELSLNTDWNAKVHCTSLYLILRCFRIFTFWKSGPSCVFLTTYHIGFGFSVEKISAIFSLITAMIFVLVPSFLTLYSMERTKQIDLVFYTCIYQEVNIVNSDSFGSERFNHKNQTIQYTTHVVMTRGATIVYQRTSWFTDFNLN